MTRKEIDEALNRLATLAYDVRSPADIRAVEAIRAHIASPLPAGGAEPDELVRSELRVALAQLREIETRDIPQPVAIRVGIAERCIENAARLTRSPRPDRKDANG